MGASYTGKQRFEAAFKGEKLDRQPVMLLLGGQYAEKAGVTLEQFLTQPEAAIEVTRLTCEELESDALFAPLNPLMPDAQEAFRKLSGKPPSIKRADIKEKLPKWSVRLPREDRLFSAHLDMCERCVKEFPDYQVLTMIGGLWTFALDLRGIMEGLEDVYEDKQFLHDLVNYTTETVIGRCLATVELGVLPFVGEPSAGMSVISPAVYQEFVLPYHRRLVDAIHEKGARLIMHICGYMDPIYEDVISTGVDGLSIDGPSSLEKLFEAGRGKTTIVGNVDPMQFVEGTPEKLAQEAKRCLDIAEGEARYVVAPGCQIPLQCKLENIKAFTDACHRYGAF